MNYKPEDGFPYYFALTEGKDLNTLFGSMTTFDFLKSIDEEMAGYRYAPGKWNVKQIIGHITDHERIKMFRAFQLSRNEKIELWGYDQDFLVKNSRFEELSMPQLMTDYINVRKASVSFIDTLSEDQLKIKGRARKYEVSLEEFLRSIVGHEMHHLKIVEEKYM